MQFLGNKFSWAHVVASQKDMLFSVTDSSLATEFGLADDYIPYVGELRDSNIGCEVL
jgi:hypothetical protein